MILPVVVYGDAVLRKKTAEIDKDYPNLNQLIKNMWETMYKANGVGLAAPQIGLSIRLFIVDTLQVEEDEEGNVEERGVKQVFINTTITEKNGKPYAYSEGCLSIPGVREDVTREPDITITYYDENFKKHQVKFTGTNARVILHEYDHIEGVLFIDYLKPLKKRLLKKQLTNISKGIVDAKYKMRFPKK